MWMKDMLLQSAEETSLCKKIIACFTGKASGFAIQIYEEAKKKGWPGWESTQVEEGTVVGLKFMIEERFGQLKRPEEALIKLEGYCQGGDEDIEEYLTNFQNLKSEAGITNDFAQRILLKNARRDLVEEAILVTGEIAYEALVQELKRVGQ